LSFAIDHTDMQAGETHDLVLYTVKFFNTEYEIFFSATLSGTELKISPGSLNL
jgi:hypothetical protein